MRAKLAEAIAEITAKIGLPAVIVDGWPTALRANADTIRAALYSAEATNTALRGGFLGIDLLTDDWRILSASREKKGWVVKLGADGRADCFAARPGSKHLGARVKMTRLRSFLFRYDKFDWREVEQMMLEFVSTSANPRSAQWVELDWA
jgi:hypothetical protein